MSVKRKREDKDQDLPNKLNTNFRSVEQDIIDNHDELDNHELINVDKIYNREIDNYKIDSSNIFSNNELTNEFANVKYYVELLINNSNITNDLIEYTNLYSELLYNILDINKIYLRRIYSLNELLLNDNIYFLNDKYVSGENNNLFKYLFDIINKISEFLWTLPISSF